MTRNEFLNGKVDDIFAVGCFHFVQPDWNKPDFSRNDYSSDISTSLERIDNVSNVNVSDISGFREIGFHPEYEDDEEGYLNIPFVPCPSLGTVSFDVFIPKRVQQDVFPRGDPAIKCEKFKILVDFGGDFPITLIKAGEPLKGDLSLGFSDFVPIVRNYLASRWPKDAPIKFACLGPSPFHSEFYFRSSDTEDLRIDKRRGYDSILYQGPDMIGFYKQIRVVLPNYYLLVYMRNRVMELDYLVSSQIRSVIDRLTERNIIQRIKNHFNHSNKKDIADIYSLRFESDYIKRTVYERISYHKRGDDAFTDSPLWEYVEEAKSESSNESDDDLNQLLRLAEIFEMGGSTNSSTIFAALASALLTAMVAVFVAIITDDNNGSSRVEKLDTQVQTMGANPATKKN